MLLLLLVGDFWLGDVIILCSLLPGLVSLVIIIFNSPLLSSAKLLNTVRFVMRWPLLLLVFAVVILLLIVLILLMLLLLFALLMMILLLLLLLLLIMLALLLVEMIDCLPEDF